MKRLMSLLVFLGLAVAAQPYTIEVNPSTISVAPGQSATTSLTVLPRDQFTGTLNISATNLPGGVSISPGSITVSRAGENATVNLVFTASAGASTGSGTVRLTVGDRVHFVSVVVDPRANPPSQAPNQLQQIWQGIQQWGSTACTTINAFSLEGVRWICTIYRTLSRAVGMWDTIQSDFEMLKREGFITGVSYLVNGLAGEAGLAEVNVTADQLERDFLDLRRNYRATVARINNWLQRQRERQMNALINNPYPSGSPSWWAVEAISLNPNLLQMELFRQEQRVSLGQELGKIQTTVGAAQAPIERMAQEANMADMEKALAVTNPGIVPGQEGEAERISRRAQEAQSTREVMQVLVDAQASIMRQNLANSQDIVNSIRETAVQQAFTTQQIGNLVSLKIRERKAKADSWRGELEGVMARAAEETEAQLQNLRLVAAMSRSVACPDGVLGPNAYGYITCIRP